MDKFTLENYNNWLVSDYIDLKDREDLKSIQGDEKEIEDRFYTNLSFGTGGMRGLEESVSIELINTLSEKQLKGLLTTS